MLADTLLGSRANRRCPPSLVTVSGRGEVGGERCWEKQRPACALTGAGIGMMETDGGPDYLDFGVLCADAAARWASGIRAVERVWLGHLPGARPLAARGREEAPSQEW